MTCPADKLHDLLQYDQESGSLTWLLRPEGMFQKSGEAQRWNKRFAGQKAFSCENSKGYLIGKIFGVIYRSHRVAWALHHGNWPNSFVDHINGIRTDNRISNLRVTDLTGNNRNIKKPARNKSGFIGVYQAENGKWVATISEQKRCRHLGTFEDLSEAVAVRKKAEADLGYHANHGRDQ